MRPSCKAALCMFLVPLIASCAAATVHTPAPAGLEEEARRFMADFAADLLSHDADAIVARYSRRGTHIVFPGEWGLRPHDSIPHMYPEGWQGPEAFEWQDLSYEVVGDDAVAVLGGLRFEAEENGGFLGTYTALLVREDGELRIRLENESWDNLPPAECAAQKGACDLPLEHPALERYTGEYEVAEAQHHPGSTADHDTLLATIAELDQRYFEAYNTCDLATLRDLHARGLEAYHDIRGGPADWDAYMEGLANRVCGQPVRVRRELIPGTLQAHPLAGFGALHMADHRFYQIDAEGEERPAGSGRMIAVWQNTDGDWKISRLISYDHVPPAWAVAGPAGEHRDARVAGASAGEGMTNQPALADTIRSLTRELAASWTRLEPDAYLDRFSDDLGFYFEGARVSRADFEAIVRGTMESLLESTFEVLDPEVEVLGPDAAVVSFGLHEVMRDRSGVVTDLRGALTLVYERRDGEWLIVQAHESLEQTP